MADTNRDQNVIHADPNKAFFIDMLTRDIPLAGCILDLIDNSVHSLVLETGLDVMRTLRGLKTSSVPDDAEVRVDFTPSKFVISDTCGGISVDEARNAVFKLGNPNPDKQHAGLGVYGIGMKRAIFKLGGSITIESNTRDEQFGVTIDVENWKRERSWDLRFDFVKHIGDRRKLPGTEITVRNLREGVGRTFSRASFLNELKRRVSTTFALFLKAGLSITVNDAKITPSLPEFAKSKNVTIGQKTFTIDGVEALVMAGLSPTNDRNARGWYVFCNGRMVLGPDQTHVTGWGEGLPAFHAKYNHFLGYLYLRAKDPNRLPWTTTKEGIDSESHIYQSALAEMKLLARPVLDFLSKKYPTDIQAEGVPERETHERAKAVSVERVAASNQRSSVFEAKVAPRASEKFVNILYKRRREDVERIRRAVGKPKMSASKVGEYTFDVFLRRECD